MKGALFHHVHEGPQQLPYWSASIRSVEAVEAARERGGGVVSILGRQGSGRTTLLHTLQHQFGDEALSVAVEQWVSELPLALFDRLVEVTVPALHATLMPQLAKTFHNAKNQLGSAFADASRKILQQLTESGPRVVLIDDVEFADTSSQHLLSYLCRRLENTGLVVVFTATPTSPQLVPDMLGLLNSPGCSRVEVTPLESSSIAMVAESMGIHGLDSTGLTALIEHTGGWLDYVVQTLRELPGGQWPLDPSTLPIPQQLITEVMTPIKQCDHPDVRKLVYAMAVVETPTGLDVLQRVAEIHDILTAIDVAVEHGILRNDIFREAYNTEQTQLAFAHPLAAKVILGQMLPSEQRKYHLRAGEFTDNHGARLLHRAAAQLTRDPVLGGELIRFADRLSRNGRWEQSARFSFAAARLFSSGSQRQEQVLFGVDALASAGRVTTAVPWLPTLEAMPSSPSRDAVLANVELHRGQAANVDRLLDRAHANATQQSTQAMIALRRCLDMLCRWDTQGVVDWANRAAELSKSGDVTEIEALAIRSVGLAALGETTSADDSILQAALRQGDGPQNQRYRLCAGWMAILEGDFRTAYRELEAAIPTQSRGGSLRISLWAQAWLARVQFLLGDWDSALRGAQDGLRRAEHAGIEVMMSLLEWTAKEIQLWRGQTPQAAYQSSIGSTQMRGYLAMQVPSRLTRAVECQVRNDYEGALASLMPLIDSDPWVEGQASFWHWQPQLVRALIAADRLDDAATLSADFSANTTNSPPMVRATALASEAHVAAAKKDHNTAEKRFLVALQLTSKDGLATYHGQFLFAYGQMLRRAGRRKDAAARLVSAREFFFGVRATRMVEQCNQELRATGMRHFRDPDEEVAAETTSTASLTAQLTPQEHTIARLVVKGLTNRETARKLFIAEKTVQYHLTRIYAKFAIRSRTELARVYQVNDATEFDAESGPTLQAEDF